ELLNTAGCVRGLGVLGRTQQRSRAGTPLIQTRLCTRCGAIVFRARPLGQDLAARGNATVGTCLLLAGRIAGGTKIREHAQSLRCHPIRVTVLLRYVLACLFLADCIPACLFLVVADATFAQLGRGGPLCLLRLGCATPKSDWNKHEERESEGDGL